MIDPKKLKDVEIEGVDLGGRRIIKKFVTYARHEDGTELDINEMEWVTLNCPEFIQELAEEYYSNHYIALTGL
jgi:hypothetical protein